MDRKDFDRLLSQGKIPSVLLFEGEEEHMKQSALDALQKKLLPEGLEELNRTLLDAPETDQIIAAAETLPFMADRRLVVVRNHPALIGRAEADDATTHGQAFDLKRGNDVVEDAGVGSDFGHGEAR